MLKKIIIVSLSLVVLFAVLVGAYDSFRGASTLQIASADEGATVQAGQVGQRGGRWG